MRSVTFMIAGLVLLGAGIAVIALETPGRFLLGPALIVGGLLFKVGGFLLTDDPGGGQQSGGRTTTTLGGQAVERPRPGIPAGRTNALRSARATARPPTGRPTRVEPAAADPARDRRAS